MIEPPAQHQHQELSDSRRMEEDIEIVNGDSWGSIDFCACDPDAVAKTLAIHGDVTHLYFRDMSIDKTVVDAVARLPRLELISFSHCRPVDIGFEPLRNCKTLRDISFNLHFRQSSCI